MNEALGNTPHVELVKRLRQGDEVAFALLYRSMYAAVLRTAYLVLGSREQAEDVAQEAFLRLWLYRARLEERPLLPWLLTVATHACFSLRRRKREFLLEEEPAVMDDELSPEDRLFYLQVVETMNGLPKKQRAIAALRLLHDFSEEETARILGCAPGTVGAALHQAKERMRKRLGID